MGPGVINTSPYFFCIYALGIALIVDFRTLRHLGKVAKGGSLQFLSCVGTFVIATSIFDCNTNGLKWEPYLPAVFCVFGFTAKIGSLMNALVGVPSFKRISANTPESSNTVSQV